MTKAQKEFLEHALSRIKNDARILGLAAGGSWVTGEMDKFSDLDLVIVVDSGRYVAVLSEMDAIAHTLGPCLASFPGDHLGVPNLLICLYDNPLLHVDLKFVALDDFSQRIENPEVLWERDGALTRVIESSKPAPATLDLQWMEDRFWIWIHYAALLLGRGEIFEVLEVLTFLRSRVLGPLASANAGKPLRGVRRMEQYCPADVAALKNTVAAYDARSCEKALKSAARMYLDLRETLASNNLRRNRRAEMATLRCLHDVSDSLRSLHDANETALHPHDLSKPRH